MLAIAYCLGISTLYVASLYLWRVPACRQHPATVRARMLSVLLTCSVAWIPTWHMRQQVLGEANKAGLTSADDQGYQLPGLLHLLGFGSHGHQLARALVQAAGLTILMFVGPLHHKAWHWQQWRAKQQLTFWATDNKPWLHQLRDYAVAPIAEEFCFRACMVPLLWMQGATWQTLVFATPLFFGVCHLHHAWGLSQVHGPSGHIMALCFLQFLYTTVFGWYATWVFLCTGSILASMLVHSLCNIMGLPPFSQMGWLSLALTVCGVLAAGVVLCLLPSQASKDHHFWWRQQPLH